MQCWWGSALIGTQIVVAVTFEADAAPHGGRAQVEQGPAL